MELRDDAAGEGLDGLPLGRRESPESWEPNRERLRGSDLSPALPKSSDERCEAL